MTLTNLKFAWEGKSVTWPNYLLKLEKFKTEQTDCDKILKSHEHSNEDKILSFRKVYQTDLTRLFAELVNEEIELLHKSTVLSTQLKEQANEFYRAGNFTKALQGYTLSICYAQPKTKAQLLGYSNRSACLKEMNDVASSLTDIKLAFDLLSHPIDDLTDVSEKDKIIKKLTDRKTRCMQIPKSSQQTENQTHEKFFSLKNPNPSIPSAEDFVQIVQNEEMGRHVVVTKDIKPGSVLIIESPYSKSLRGQYKWKLDYCHHCLKSLRGSRSHCSQCIFAVYCNSQCMEKALPIHQFECPISPFLHRMDFPQLVIVSFRTILTLGPSGLYNHWKQKLLENPPLLGFTPDGKYLSTNYDTIYHLIYHLNSLSVDELKKYCLQAVLIVDLLDRFTPFFEIGGKDRDSLKNYGASLIFLHIMNLPFNAHALNDFFLPENPYPDDIRCAVATDIGAGAFSLLSMINHSCDPNVTRVTLPHGRTAVVSIRSLKSGEQVLDNYGVHYATHCKAKRQKHLYKQYYFQCACVACKHEWPSIDEGLVDTPTRLACVECMKNVPFHDKLKSSYRKCLFVGNNWKCEKCNKEYPKKSLKEKIIKYEELCSSGYDLVLDNKPMESIPVLVETTEFFENNGIPPIFTLNIAQESLKQAYNLLTIGLKY